jgi:hypothetical protein
LDLVDQRGELAALRREVVLDVERLLRERAPLEDAEARELGQPLVHDLGADSGDGPPEPAGAEVAGADLRQQLDRPLAAEHFLYHPDARGAWRQRSSSSHQSVTGYHAVPG